MDGRPGCVCAERAAQTLHAERSAQAAATEEFDPLRIRPYVMLPNASAAPDEGPSGVVGVPDAERTMRLGAVVAAARPDPVRAPRPTVPDGAGAPRRRRRLVALTAGAAAAVVIATAAFASTLFADDATPKRALPDAADTGLPYSGGDTAPAGTPSASASPSKKATPSRSPSARPSPTPSASASRAASPTPSKHTPTPSPSAPGPSASTGGKPVAPPPSTTLRRGDSGPGVLELQERLAQLGLYSGHADGTFGSRTERAVRDFQSYTGVSGDPAGVYGPPTRQALESMTDQP
ncbi:peptidoglycan-binding protein [Streptomyces hundungensis]|uniref:peptidoglycan-binding protein n=1 Tax=Streptomyces hundungensis TaxID=1077946 RepID=UPI001FEA41D7|nr:peptidoglycan-binding protein [Streptomyces hundungensis]